MQLICTYQCAGVLSERYQMINHLGLNCARCCHVSTSVCHAACAATSSTSPSLPPLGLVPSPPPLGVVPSQPSLRGPRPALGVVPSRPPLRGLSCPSLRNAGTTPVNAASPPLARGTSCAAFARTTLFSRKTRNWQ